MNHFVSTIDLSLTAKLKRDLESKGFSFANPPFTIFQAKSKDVCCTLYQSGKILVQGKGLREFIEFYLEPEILQAIPFTLSLHAAGQTFGQVSGQVSGQACASTPSPFSSSLLTQLDLTERMGSDEAGKGDFFGPLCVAAVFADKQAIAKLAEAKVQDSKNLSDRQIQRIAPQIKECSVWQIITLRPKKYNELYLKFKNLNRLLAWCHASLIETIAKKTHCTQAIVDQFAKEFVLNSFLKNIPPSLKVIQRTKAESDLVVAAASILARDAFLTGLKDLGQKYQIQLPKGGGALTIPVGQTIYQKYGLEGLEELSKVHFKNFLKITEPSLF